MKESLGQDFERRPSKPKKAPFMEMFLQINKEQIKNMEKELLAMRLPASALASILRMPESFLEDHEDQ